MPIPSDISFGWALVLAAPSFILCTYLEIQFRRKLRDGHIDRRRYSKRQLEEFNRIRDRMFAKRKQKKP
ncbi:MAG: hypothetical protein K0Q87_4537 [Neobacillus sp.]|nr:hypothetical protein [Neobacillus sp.]